MYTTHCALGHLGIRKDERNLNDRAMELDSLLKPVVVAVTGRSLGNLLPGDAVVCINDHKYIISNTITPKERMMWALKRRMEMEIETQPKLS